jgi:hypothetical protein
MPIYWVSQVIMEQIWHGRAASTDRFIQVILRVVKDPRKDVLIGDRKYPLR